MIFSCVFLFSSGTRIAQLFHACLGCFCDHLVIILFVFSILIVFRVIPYWIGPVVIVAVLLFMDRKALKMVDYPLLLTFL